MLNCVIASGLVVRAYKVCSRVGFSMAGPCTFKQADSITLLKNMYHVADMCSPPDTLHRTIVLYAGVMQLSYPRQLLETLLV